MEFFSGLDFFQPEGATTAGLLALRLTGLIWIAPVFSSRVLKTQTKSAILIVLVAALWPVAMSHAVDAGFSVVLVLSELLVGLTLGLAGAIFIAAAESAGDMLAVQMGLSGANVVDPMSSTQLPVLGQFLGLFVTAMVLALGGHTVILTALSKSLQLLPIGTPVDFAAGLPGVIDLGSKLLWLGLKIAGPVIAAMMIGNASLGVLARTVPQLNVLMVAFPVQIAIGLFVLGGTLPFIASFFTGWNQTYLDLAGELLLPLTPVEGGS